MGILLYYLKYLVNFPNFKSSIIPQKKWSSDNVWKTLKNIYVM